MERAAKQLACSGDAVKFMKLVLPTLREVLELVLGIFLLQALGLLSSLFEFACSSLWPSCSKEFPTDLPAPARSMNFAKVVWATFGMLLELVQDIFLLQALDLVSRLSEFVCSSSWPSSSTLSPSRSE